MTGDAASILTSDDPDLEDGEIATDDEEAEADAPAPAQQQQQPSKPRPEQKEKERERERDGRGEHRGDRRGDDRRGGRRPRPNEAHEEEPERKRKKISNEDEDTGEVVEEEMLGLCVRGGSPSDDLDLDLDAAVWRPKTTGHMDTGWAEENDDRKRPGRRSSPLGRRTPNDSRARLQMKRKMKPNRKGVADKEVCLNYMKGACNKGNDCTFSHNVCQPRKMELCKFYLKDCCMKRDKCLYLHEEFPCKFFHTGQTCYADKACKFSHDPLTPMTREVLIKHVETAPKDILGDFPRMSRSNAEAVMGGGPFPDPANPDAENREPGQEEPNDKKDDSPRNRRRDDQRNWNRREGDDRRSPPRNRRSPDNQGRFRRGRDDQDDRRRGRDDRRRDRRDDDSPRKRNNGPDRPNNFNNGPNFGPNNFGPNNNNFGGMPNNFNPNFNPNFGPNDNFNRGGFGPNNRFGPDNQQFGPNNNMFGGNNFGPNGPNFNPNLGSMFVPNQFGQNFNNFEGMNNMNNQNENPMFQQQNSSDAAGPISPNGQFVPNNQDQFGPINQNQDQFGLNNQNQGQFGPNNQNQGQFGSNNQNQGQFGPNNQNQGQFGPNNQNQGQFGPNNLNQGNFGANNQNQSQFGPNNQNQDQFGPNNQNEDQFGPNNQNQSQRFGGGGSPDRHGDRSRKKEGRGGNRSDEGRRKDERRSPRQGGHGRSSHERDHRRMGQQGDRWRSQDDERGDTPAETATDDQDASQESQESQFDFAKELAEYKNKKIEIELARLHTEIETVIERPPVLNPHLQPEADPAVEEPNTQPTEDPNAFPPAFTQVYPPFPSAEEKQPKVKEKDREKPKKHHHKKKKRHSTEHAEEEPESKKSRKERREKKRQPVIISEDGGFGGIKFKIKLNSSKDEGKPKGEERRLSEFMSSDDEVPLTSLKKHKKKKQERRNSGFGGDGDETDTESRLVIETNDEPEERPQDEGGDDGFVPKHLPKRQQELFKRIQGHQSQTVVPTPHDSYSLTKSYQETEEASRRSGSPGEKTPEPRTPEPADENWYSSDEEAPSSKAMERDVASIPIPQMPHGMVNAPYGVAGASLPERSTTPPGPPPVPKIELAALKDLSKINITELLTSIRQIAGKSVPAAPAMSPVVAPFTSPRQEGEHRERKEAVKDPRAKDPRASGQQQQHPRRASAEKPPYAKSIYDAPPVPKDLDLRVKPDVDERPKEGPSLTFGDVDLRVLGDGPLPPIGLGLPFKPAPLHQAATEIEASLASHPPIDYKVVAVFVPKPDFSTIKISAGDPLVKKDPRLRRLFRVSSVDEPPSSLKPEDAKKPTLPVDPRRKNQAPASPETPLSPPMEPVHSAAPAAAPRLTPQLLALVQLGLSAATGGSMDPRMRNMLPADLEALRSAISGLRPEDVEAIRNADLPDAGRPPGQGLLPTPGMGLLPTPPAFMMNSMMPMDPMMVGPLGPMGPMGGPMNQAMGGPMGGPMNQQMGPFGFGADPSNDADMRVFRANFRGNDRRGRGNWRGGPREHNWENHRTRQRRMGRDRDDRRERRSFSPEQAAQ